MKDYSRMWEEVLNFTPMKLAESRRKSAGSDDFLSWIESIQAEYYGPGSIYEPGQHGQHTPTTSGAGTTPARPSNATGGNSGRGGFLTQPGLGRTQNGDFMNGSSGPTATGNMAQWRNNLGIAQAEQAAVPQTHNRTE